ncbi:hypothetical protein L593_02995 [Salinarchaeum sp. Harcht-Bsk1]|nr:hypothetical protein [Salinarchaeum sp. Harcht-Bsk1]AGN00550.1 hypothetical protein L593_02995 [Salinarchaeum sp. Harcht-Bsk1]
MIDVSGLPGWTQAAALIGVVLVEAMVLYVGYGALEQAIGQKLIDRLTS